MQFIFKFILGELSFLCDLRDFALKLKKVSRKAAKNAK